MLVTVGVAVGFCAVVELRLLPLHTNEVAPPAEFAVKLTVPPLQIGPSLDGAAVGVGLTVTVVVYTVTGAQPDALMLLTVSEYVLVTVGVAVGFCAVVELRLLPLHTNDVAPPAGLAVRLTVPPLQIGPSFEGAAVGVGLTVTVVVYTVTGAQPDALILLTVNE